MPPFLTIRASRKRLHPAFTLVELLVVIVIIVVVLGLVVPAVSSLKGGGDVTKAVYDVSGALETARAYAKANSTYVWVGFYEEAEKAFAPSPAQPDKGRVIISIVASKDGTLTYNPNALAEMVAGTNTKLVSVGKLIRLDNIHLATFADGSDSGTTFATRPGVDRRNNPDTTGHIGDRVSDPSSTGSATPFYYPVNVDKSKAQYKFIYAIEFTPRGECRLNNASSGYKPLIEIGLRPTHGTAIATNSANVAAIQVSGITGTVTVYRP